MISIIVGDEKAERLDREYAVETGERNDRGAIKQHEGVRHDHKPGACSPPSIAMTVFDWGEFVHRNAATR
jgi:hypothetical protein